MNEQEYDIMYALEENHWWFATKRAIVFDQYNRHVESRSRPCILDIGCGTGIVLLEHAKRGSAFGVDMNPHALAATRRRSIAAPLVRASAGELPFASDSFDVVTCLDVLYHRGVSGDAIAAEEIYRVLRPGGLAILTDSALPCLWSRHDEVMHAARRYTRGRFEDLLIHAGFKVLKSSYMNFFLLPLVFVKRKLEKVMPGPAKSDVGRVGAIQNIILGNIYNIEKYLLRRFSLPIGSSVLAVARKPDNAL